MKFGKARRGGRRWVKLRCIHISFGTLHEGQTSQRLYHISLIRSGKRQTPMAGGGETAWLKKRARSVLKQAKRLSQGCWSSTHQELDKKLSQLYQKRKDCKRRQKGNSSLQKQFILSLTQSLCSTCACFLDHADLMWFDTLPPVHLCTEAPIPALRDFIAQQKKTDRLSGMKDLHVKKTLTAAASTQEFHYRRLATNNWNLQQQTFVLVALEVLPSFKNQQVFVSDEVQNKVQTCFIFFLKAASSNIDDNVGHKCFHLRMLSKSDCELWVPVFATQEAWPQYSLLQIWRNLETALSGCPAWRDAGW